VAVGSIVVLSAACPNMGTGTLVDVIYPDGSFLASLFSECPSVEKVVLERQRIAVYLTGSDKPCTDEDLRREPKVRAYLEGIPDLM
jgi:hypothetical protein